MNQIKKSKYIAQRATEVYKCSARHKAQGVSGALNGRGPDRVVDRAFRQAPRVSAVTRSCTHARALTHARSAQAHAYDICRDSGTGKPLSKILTPISSACVIHA